MALISCAECRKEISSKAKRCPHCGVKIKKPTGPITKAIALVVFGSFVVSAVLVHVQDANKPPPPPPTPEQKAASAKEKAAMDMAALGAKDLKHGMKDPQAFELTSLLVMPDGVACYDYRAKNSFGAILPGSAVLKNGKFLIQEKNGNDFVRVWNKECTVPGGQDIVGIIKRAGMLD